MKKNCYYIFFLLIISYFTLSHLFAGAVIVDFKGDAGKNKVVLRWSTLSESNCREFQIERSLDRTRFQKIGTVDAVGNSSQRKDYEYEDRTVFRTTANTFYYRIKIVEKDGTESLFSEIIAVTPSVSGVQHTWGSIKALFR